MSFGSFKSEFIASKVGPYLRRTEILEITTFFTVSRCSDYPYFLTDSACFDTKKIFLENIWEKSFQILKIFSLSKEKSMQMFYPFRPCNFFFLVFCTYCSLYLGLFHYPQVAPQRCSRQKVVLRFSKNI